MLLYLVRHGETALNAQGVYQGHLPTPLNEAGRKQAERLGDHLRSVPFKECWTSHLPRAAETARLVPGPHHPKTSIQLEPLLTDRAMGALEGKPWVADPAAEGAAFGVESDEALAARLHKFLSNQIQTHTPLSSPLTSPRTPSTPSEQGSGCVLVVTHEACLLALLQILTDSGATEYFPGTAVAEPAELYMGIKADEMTDEPAELIVEIKQPAASPISPTAGNGSKTSTLPVIVDTHIPADVDVGLQCANTALCVVRVWWEEGEGGKGEDGGYLECGLEAKGRVEVWGDIAHLDT